MSFSSLSSGLGRIGTFKLVNDEGIFSWVHSSLLGKHRVTWSFMWKVFILMWYNYSQLSPVAQSCPTLCNPMDCSMTGFPGHHQLPELAQTHVCQVGDAIQPSHPLSSPSPPALNLSQHQGLFQWISSSIQVAKVLELQLQHQSFQWVFMTDFP